MNNVLEEKFEFGIEGAREEVWWDKKNQIGRNKMIGAIDKKAAQWVKSRVEMIGEARERKVNWLVDIGGALSITNDARKVLSKLNNNVTVNKIAFVGGSTFSRILTNLLVTVSGKANTRHFIGESDAIKWLNE